MAQLQLEVGRGERRGVLAPGFSSLPRSTSSSGYPEPTTEDAAVSGSIPEFTARGPIGGIFRGLTPEAIIPPRVSDMEDPVQPFTENLTDHTMSERWGGSPDNSTLCRFKSVLNGKSQRVADHGVQANSPMSRLAIVSDAATNRALLRDRVVYVVKGFDRDRADFSTCLKG